jgi:GT2 family glycosyltransferase
MAGGANEPSRHLYADLAGARSTTDLEEPQGDSRRDSLTVFELDFPMCARCVRVTRTVNSIRALAHERTTLVLQTRDSCVRAIPFSREHSPFIWHLACDAASHMSAQGRTVSVVIPFRRNLPQLAECLGALHPLPDWAEVIVVSDGVAESCHRLATESHARVVEIAESRGPAAARNRGAEAALGEVLVFIDADVVAAPGVLARIRDLLQRRPDIAALFGAYDEQPRDRHFMAQYKNLSHFYFHQASRGAAVTFWAGLGAVRRDVFATVGGFDERFMRPCVEDIELGYRMSRLGHRILLDPSIRGCHLKRWTLRSSVVTDVRDRGIPWTQLIFKFARLDNNLNLQTNQRLAVALAYALIALLALATTALQWLVPAGVALLMLAGLNWRYYAFFHRRKGLWFCCQVFPAHLLHHWCNGLSFMAGTAIFYAHSVGLRFPGAVPLDEWKPDMVRLQPTD